MKNRGKISFLFLLAYIFVLAASFIPHHHHHSTDYCTHNISQHSPAAIEIPQSCCNDSEESCCPPNESNGCSESKCLSKHVYLHHSGNGKTTSGQSLLLHASIPITANHGTSFAFLVLQKATCSLSYYIVASPIKTLFLKSSLSLRAPPAISHPSNLLAA